MSLFGEGEGCITGSISEGSFYTVIVSGLAFKWGRMIQVSFAVEVLQLLTSESDG